MHSPHTPEGQACTESEAQTRAILEMAFDAIVETDSQGVITGWNSKAASTFGWSEPEVMGRVLFQVIVPPRFRDAYEEKFRNLLASGESPMGSERLEIKALRRDGREFYIEVIMSALRRGDSDQASILGRDITRQKQLEKALRISEERARVILDRIEDACFEVELSDEARYLFVNHAFCEITGYSAEEMLGKGYRQFFDAETIRQLDVAYRRVFETGEPLKALEYALIRKDGTKRTYDCYRLNEGPSGSDHRASGKRTLNLREGRLGAY